MLRRMLAWPDHVLFVVLVLLGPVWGSLMGFRRLKRAASGDLPRVRRSVYRTAIAVQWTLTFATIAWWLAAHRPWGAIGLVPVFNLGLAGVVVGFAVVFVLVLRQRAQVLHDDESLADVRRKLAHLERMMPRTRNELAGFYRLSVTAGICEELLYRGFLIWYLAHFTGLIQAVALAAVIFGLGHAYQGVRGMLVTAAVGAFFGAVYAISGSLFVPMLMHGLMDAHSGSLAFAAYRRGDELEAEARAARALEWERLERERAEAEAARRREAQAEADAAIADAGEREGTDAAGT